MKPLFVTIAVWCLTGAAFAAAASERISLPSIPGLTRTDIYVTSAGDGAAGTLLLCPGRNGNGGDMVDNPAWSDFAKKEHLNLVGLSFASDDDLSEHSYFQAESGSGQLLLDGMRQALGPKPGPLLIYGFSRGAQFAFGLARWKPELVLAWCAYSATAWAEPATGPREPHGIIACGEEDEPNYSTSMCQFLEGRSLAKPWTWVSLPHTGHVPSSALEGFARAYFASVLLHPGGGGFWFDVDTKSPVSARDLREHPTLAAWLPDESVAEAWKNLHQP